MYVAGRWEREHVQRPSPGREPSLWRRAQTLEHQKGGPGDRIMEDGREIMATCCSLQHYGTLCLETGTGTVYAGMRVTDYSIANRRNRESMLQTSEALEEAIRRGLD